jgi:hypothetical protein
MACAGCGDETPQRTAIPAEVPSLSSAPTGTQLAFTPVSPESSGLEIINVSGGRMKLAIPENIGQGAAVLDFDSDGDLDIFIANGGVLPGVTAHAPLGSRLYRNDGGFHFTDVTVAAGVFTEAWVHGVWAVDFDGDGDRDLYLTVFGGPNIFFENLGGKFVNASDRWGGDDKGPSTAAAFFDADGDGDLDLYVGNYVDYDPARPPNEGRPCSWRGLSVSCGPLGTTPAPDRFYRNDGGRLVEATEAHGFTAPASYCLGLLARDLDEDGDTDLLVVNDSVPNFLFLNQGNGRFEESAMACGADRNEDGRAQSGMGVDAGDVDLDLKTDVFITNFSHDTNTMRRGGRTRDGALFFTDVTFAMKLGAPSFAKLSWGTRMLDLDGDGDEDLVVVSGHVYPQVDGADVGTSYAQENQVFLNQGPQGARQQVVFEEWQPPLGDGFRIKECSRGLVAADFDDDGDHDLLITEMDTRPTLLRNDTRTSNSWIGFELIGLGGNREAIGARVVLEDSTGKKQVRQRSFGGGFLSTSDARLHFGLGQRTGPARITVYWPYGPTTVHENLLPNRYHRIAHP